MSEAGERGRGCGGNLRDYSDNLTIEKSNNFKKEELYMLFGPGILIAGGTTIVMAVLDKTLDDLGYQWLGTALKLIIPLAGIALGAYFLEVNPMVWWIK